MIFFQVKNNKLNVEASMKQVDMMFPPEMKDAAKASIQNCKDVCKSFLYFVPTLSYILVILFFKFIKLIEYFITLLFLLYRSVWRSVFSDYPARDKA